MTSASALSNRATLQQYRHEMSQELDAILSYWVQNSVDKENGGFFGSIDHNNIPVPLAERGVVMYSRICWAFSAAIRETGNHAWKKTATRAYDYLTEHFIDRKFGGVYWSVDAKGKPLNSKKQIYGLAFCIYAMSEYYMAFQHEQALELAKEFYDTIERYSYDAVKNGYIEAFSREWNGIEDIRLSEKDSNDRKTANTHLHIVEAYTNLYQVWPDEGLREKIANLLELFRQYFIGNDGHLCLFFNDDWQPTSELISYGHDIEAAWLLLQCAEVVGDEKLIQLFREYSIQLSSAAASGLDEDGGLWYEMDGAAGSLIREKHSWPQAEAMIGFFDAWENSAKQDYLDKSLRSWHFVKRHIKDHQNGEWFWGVKEDYAPMQKDKAGFWKCPYHNTRACLELLRRIPG